MQSSSSPESLRVRFLPHVQERSLCSALSYQIRCLQQSTYCSNLHFSRLLLLFSTTFVHVQVGPKEMSVKR